MKYNFCFQCLKIFYSGHRVSNEYCKDYWIESDCKKVHETVRYSDPMSNVALVEVEDEIQNKFADFKNAVKNENYELASSAADELLSLIDIRNKKCSQACWSRCGWCLIYHSRLNTSKCKYKIQ